MGIYVLGECTETNEGAAETPSSSTRITHNHHHMVVVSSFARVRLQQINSMINAGDHIAEDGTEIIISCMCFRRS